MTKVENKDEWVVKAKKILRAELRRKDVSYRDLTANIIEIGNGIGEHGVANKVSRGGFSASFLVQCFEAIGEREIRL